jgi:hypothetical protein
MASENGYETSFQTITNFESIPPRYLDRLDAASSFDLDWGWFKLLINHSLTEQEFPRLHVAENTSGDRVLLPVRMTKSPWGGWQVGALVNFYSTFYAPILSTPASGQLFKPLFKRLRSASPAPARFMFYPMDPDSAVFQAMLSGMKAAGLAAFSYYCFGNWYLPCPGMGWEEYLRTRTKKMRSNIKRMEKKFADAQGVIKFVAGEEADLDEFIAAYERVYASSWKQPEPFPQFVPGLIRMAAATGTLRLGVAYLDEAPIAAQLWLVRHGKASIYKVAYDENYAGFSPGTVLTAYMLRHALENDRVNEVDYLIGDDAYKKCWMSHRRERWGIVAYNPWTLSGWLGIVRQVAGTAYKKLRGRLRHSEDSPITDNLSG